MSDRLNQSGPRVRTGDLRGLLDHATTEIALAIASVYGRRLAPREIDAARESIAALIRLVIDMPSPRPPLPREDPPKRERKHGRWIPREMLLFQRWRMPRDRG